MGATVGDRLGIAMGLGEPVEVVLRSGLRRVGPVEMVDTARRAAMVDGCLVRFAEVLVLRLARPANERAVDLTDDGAVDLTAPVADPRGDERAERGVGPGHPLAFLDEA